MIGLEKQTCTWFTAEVAETPAENCLLWTLTQRLFFFVFYDSGTLEIAFKEVWLYKVASIWNIYVFHSLEKHSICRCVMLLVGKDKCVAQNVHQFPICWSRLQLFFQTSCLLSSAYLPSSSWACLSSANWTLMFLYFFYSLLTQHRNVYSVLVWPLRYKLFKCNEWVTS